MIVLLGQSAFTVKKRAEIFWARLAICLLVGFSLSIMMGICSANTRLRATDLWILKRPNSSPSTSIIVNFANFLLWHGDVRARQRRLSLACTSRAGQADCSD